MKRSVGITLAVVLVMAGLVAMLFLRNRPPALPAPGSEPYEAFTRAFYWGLSTMEVGLLDDARAQFTRATTLVPEEPAAWADLGLAQLRLGEVEAAVGPIERALALAPGDSDVILLAARMEAARGRLSEAVARLRQAAAQDPRGLRARFALAEELQRLNTAEADAEALDLLDGIVNSDPDNLAALIEGGRIAARRGDEPRLRTSLDRLAAVSAAWPPQAREQLAALTAAVDARQFQEAARATIFLRNVLTPVPAYLESLAAVRTPAELIAEPLDRFLALAPPSAQPAPADPAIAFSSDAAGGQEGRGARVVLAVSPAIDQPPALFAADERTVRWLDAPGGSWPFPSDPSASAPSGHALAALDWNHDFRMDLVAAGRGGVRLLLQDENGRFADGTTQAAAADPATEDAYGAWPADVEMDGDLDLVVGATDGPPLVLRNNGNITWRRQQPFTGLAAVRGFGWADLDHDADPDAVFVDGTGTLHVFTNRQAGEFARSADVPGVSGVVAITVADLDAAGTIDIVALDSNGSVHRISWQDEAWSVAEVATWPAANGAVPGSYRLLAADLDNNGALDLIAAGRGASRIWLAGEDHGLEPLAMTPDAEIFSAADRTGDGRIDLAALGPQGPVWLNGGGGTANYHWKVIRPRAQQQAGDQRINSFGIGGEISVRSGLLVQTQVMSGTAVHFGLGTHTSIDVARILWPNGVAQAEFGTGVDDGIVAEQRLKGSCPWVFAWDGTRMGFVTDFLWRSPLGLRINAQDTAGGGQTEDWIRIAGDQLVPRDGAYDVRITAELWESHFVDHVSLMVVDHPADTEVLVDERFRPARPPALAVRVVRPIGGVSRAWDDRGHDVTDLVAARDGRYLANFPLGLYQGIANEHIVEFALGDRVPSGGRATLVASGWIYPTDSSINVAIAQGGHVRPGGVVLETRDGHGAWAVVDADLGYPAGKNKTMLVDLPDARPGQRFRVRTNLEIYWDSFVLAESVDAPLATRRVAVEDAVLRYRGYSQTTSPRGDVPETPVYERIANVTQRWRDLVGYHTRFGNVNALLSAVDDRYVIMNAGDELQLRFPAQPAPASGWRRDFVLIGDGWEKDGDYNTGFSQTVLPLPSHERSAYGEEGASGNLEDDPVYRRHRSDWEDYHTRFVTPAAFVRGLRKP